MEIEQLIEGDDYWCQKRRARYARLISQGHLEDLLELAAMAHKQATKSPASHWFARAAGVVRWETYTLPFLAKTRSVRQTAERTMERLGATFNPIDLLWLLKMIWRGIAVERWASLVMETPHVMPGQGAMQHFKWLCRYGSDLHGSGGNGCAVLSLGRHSLSVE